MLSLLAEVGCATLGPDCLYAATDAEAPERRSADKTRAEY